MDTSIFRKKLSHYSLYAEAMLDYQFYVLLINLFSMVKASHQVHFQFLIIGLS